MRYFLIPTFTDTSMKQKHIAQALVNAGYGDKKQAVEEFMRALFAEAYYVVKTQSSVVGVESIKRIFNELYGVGNNETNN